MPLKDLSEKQKDYRDCVVSIMLRKERENIRDGVNPWAVCRESVDYRGSTSGLGVPQLLGKKMKKLKE